MSREQLIRMIDDGKMEPAMTVMKHATAHDQQLHDQVVNAEKRYFDLQHQSRQTSGAAPIDAATVDSYDIIHNDLLRVAQQLPENVSVTDDIASVIYSTDESAPTKPQPLVEPIPNEPTDRTTRLEVILGVLFLFIGLAVVLIVECPTDTQLFVVRLLLALGAAAFAAIIPGVLKVTALRNIISAGGGLAVFALVYLLNPGEDMAQEGCEQTFDFSVRLQVDRPSSVYPQLEDAELRLFIGDDYREVDINSESGVFDFKSLPNELIGETLAAQLDANFWTLATEDIQLTTTTQVVAIVPDGSLEVVTGRILDASGNPVANARVDLGIPRGQTMSGENGFFELELPLDIQRVRYELTVRKEGYANTSQTIDLTQAAPQIVLEAGEN